MKPLANYDLENDVITFQNGTTIPGEIVASVEFETEACEVFQPTSRSFKTYLPGDSDITFKLVEGVTVDGKTELKASEYRSFGED